MTERIHSALNFVKYEQVKNDPAGSVTQFVDNIVKALRENIVNDVLKDEDQSVQVLNLLENMVEPATERMRIKCK